jgi:hypothetical protein
MQQLAAFLTLGIAPSMHYVQPDSNTTLLCMPVPLNLTT